MRPSHSADSPRHKTRRFLHNGDSPVHFRHLDASYPEKLAFLSDGANYPDSCGTLERIETHMAWVFLTREHAYKFKKPLFRPGQDYSSIDARYRDHQIELVLNRRLAENAYLEVLPVLVDADGRMNVSENGYACDWLLKMRRLPANRMLDALLRGSETGAAEARAIGVRLGEFYANAQLISISFGEYRQRFRRGIEFNHSILGAEEALRSRAAEVSQRQHGFLDRQAQQFDDCLRGGRFRECHGDLRPEHVCVQNEIRVIDCLQFARDHRLMDFYDDLAFFALECERLGNGDFGQAVIAQVAKITGSSAPPGLLHFYRSFRAGVRARLALLHLVYGTSADREKWIGQSRRYLDMAAAHITEAVKTS